jgi:serine/threonine-protein kinase ATR
LSGDWHGVSQKCEQALQIETTAEQKSFHLSDTESESANIRKYHLKALLELGQLESAFNQMNGIISLAKKELLKEEQQADYDIIQKNDHERNYVLPFFAEASWRLSRWDSLIQTCVDPVSTKGLLTKMNGNDSFSIAVGKTMLGLHEKDFKSVRCSLEEAHRAITPALTVASRENYTRAYPSLLQLHCLREIEDACDLLSSSEGGALSSVLDSKWHWTSRLKGVDNVSASMNIINIRLALSRIAVEPVVEAELWLTAGKRARKGGLLHISENALSHADAVCQKVINERDFKDEQLHLFLSEVKLQVAKLKYSSGHLSEAVQIIDDENVLDLLNKSGQPLENYMKKIREEGRLRLFSRSTLQATEWMVEGGTRSGSEIMARYRLLLKVSPEWERGEIFQSLQIETIH